MMTPYGRHENATPRKGITELEVGLRSALVETQIAATRSIKAFARHRSADLALQEVWEDCNRPAIAGEQFAGHCDGTHSGAKVWVEEMRNDVTNAVWLLPEVYALRALWGTQSDIVSIGEILRLANAVQKLARGMTGIAIDAAELIVEASIDLERGWSEFGLEAYDS